MASKFSKIAIDVLKVVAVVGIIGIAMTSPYFGTNIVRAIRKNKDLRKKYSEKEVGRAVYNLRRTKMVILKECNDEFKVELSAKGRKRIKIISLNELRNKKPKNWDGLWRIVVFDIPENRKVGREALREKMKWLGFYQLQKSVWVLPYGCKKEVALLVEIFEIEPFVNFIVANSIKNDKELKKHFKLT